ncbi:MAG TPA: FadR/GntR family transcriptional regulator [Trueperaceae bacterium]|jgi:GntR family transcriptional repressor for pyruvate dehydrogenase complex
MTSSYKVKRASLTDQVSHQLVRYVEEHGLQPGDPLPTEAEFAEMFGVSRTVIREGLSAAAALGLIVADPGRRSRVAPLSARVLDNFFANALRLNKGAVVELLEVREALETYGVRLAARDHDDEGLEEVRRHLESMDTALKGEDQEAFVDADVGFHMALTALSGNEVLVHLIDALRSSTRQTIASGLAARGSRLSLPAIQAVHVEIFEAVEARDPEAAAKAMMEHFALAIAAVKTGPDAA